MMPFKLPFTKTRHYNVVSRSVLVVCVELLDSSTLECTLSADCTGQHCLQNVAQRIALGQPEFFGLRYMSKRPYPKVRWVELDRPLKKQLDKYAQSPALTLSVLYYIHDMGLLQDDTTRSHFFLQVKQDVLDGKLRCNYEQAVLLASYSLQADFGDHQPDRHTPEYLKDFVVLPKLPSLSEPEVTVLLELAVWQYAALRGLAQPLAETYYIMEAQRLEGYGQETFMARDERGSEVYLGASLVGVIVRPASGQTVTTLRWNDISNLVNLKRAFGIECPKGDRTYQFTFDEPDAAKYIWKMCVKQHTFFKRNQELLETSLADNAAGEPSNSADEPAGAAATNNPAVGSNKVSMRSLTIPDLQRSVMGTTRDHSLSYQAHLTQEQQYVADQHQMYEQLIAPNLAASYSGTPVTPLQQFGTAVGMQQYAAVPKFSLNNTASQDFSSSGYLSKITNGSLMHYDSLLNSTVDASTVRIHRLDTTVASRQLSDQQLQGPPADVSSLRIQQQQQQQQQHLPYNSNPNLTTNSFRRSMLPDYRPAPDYHSVIGVSHKADTTANVKPHPLHNTYSSPDLQAACNRDAHTTSITVHQQQVPNRDAHTTSIAVHQQQVASRDQQPEKRDLTQQISSTGIGSASHAMLGYRAPPPYPGQRTPPYNKSTSTSSPDLVAAGATQLPPPLGSSWSHLPSLPQHPLAGGRGLSRTYENLCDLDDVVVSLRHHMTSDGATPQFLHSFSSLSALNSGSLDCLDEGPSVYRLPTHEGRGQQEQRPSAEPIYQNVVAYNQQQQRHLLFYKEQLQKQQQLLEHQELLQKQISTQIDVTERHQLPHHPHSQLEEQTLQSTTQPTTQIQIPIQSNTQPSTQIQIQSNTQATTQIQVHSQQTKPERKKWNVVQENLPADAEQIRILNKQAYSKPCTSEPHHSFITQYSTEVEQHLQKKQHTNVILNNPLSSSVDSTKSSPPMSTNDQLQSVGQLRAAESLNVLPSTGPANAVPNKETVAATSSDGQVRTPSKVSATQPSLNTRPTPTAGKAAAVIGTAAPTTGKPAAVAVTAAPAAGKAAAVAVTAAPTTGKPASITAPTAVTAATDAATSAPATAVAQGSTNVTNDANTASKVVKRESNDSTSAINTHKPKNSLNLDSSNSCSPTIPASASQDSALLTRIYATRDPRARQLQNELLSAELPLKYRDIAMAKPGAAYAVQDEGNTADTLPYDDNRVCLQHDGSSRGYINASHITASMGRCRQVFYMVQSLSPGASSAVWRCVWEHDVRLIVLLGRCHGALQQDKGGKAKPSKASRLLASFSKRRSKKQPQQQQEEEEEDGSGDDSDGPHDPMSSGLCFPYWPQVDNTSIECGAYRIYRRHSTQCDGYTISRLQMQHRQGGKRTIWHLHYHHGLTNTRSFIELVEQLSSLREVSQREASEESVSSPGINVNTPILLQSPSGTEHCGAVMLCHLMMGGACDAPLSRDATLSPSSRDAVTTLNMRGDGMVVDPAKLLPHLRHQRANLVPTYDMFKFVYRVMIEYFGRSRLI